MAEKRIFDLPRLETATPIASNEHIIVSDGTTTSRRRLTDIKTIVNKGDVGLSNVNNTADLDKPISTSMASALNSKANSTHSHGLSDVAGLANELNSKANTSHGHDISDVANLATSLASKANTNHTHVPDDIPGISEAIDTKVAELVPQLITAVVGTELANKANTVHTHTVADIVGFAATVDSKIAIAIPSINAGAITNSVYVSALNW